MTLTNLLKVVALSLIFIFTFYTYEAQQVLAKETALMIKESRQYTDNRIVNSQSQILSVVSEVSRTTRLLALIICQRENDRTLCKDNSHTQGVDRP